MKIPLFVQALLPQFSKDRMAEDWSTNVSILNEYVLPAYETAAEHFKTAKLKSKEAQSYDAMFHRQCRVGGRGGNLVVGTYQALLQLKKAMATLESRTDTDFGSEVAKSALTYRQANLLQLQEAVGFTLKYAMLLLRYIYVVESAHYKDSDITLAESMVPADVDQLKAGFSGFCAALNILGDPKADFSKGLDEIPDIVVKAEAASAMASTVGAHKLDPFKLNLLPVFLNPIYHVRMIVAEWQTSRFHKAKDELALTQVHLLHLKKLEAGKPDAKLRQEIAYYDNRVNQLSHQIADMEKSYAPVAA